MTPTQIPTWTLGDRLQKARSLTGLNRIDFARRLGIGEASVKRYELDHITPPDVIVYGWAVTCEVDPTWLLTGDIDPSNIDAYNARYPRDNQDGPDAHGYEQLQLVA